MLDSRDHHKIGQDCHNLTIIIQTRIEQVNDLINVTIVTFMLFLSDIPYRYYLFLTDNKLVKKMNDKS